jgi:hypothetical protein
LQISSWGFVWKYKITKCFLETKGIYSSHLYQVKLNAFWIEGIEEIDGIEGIERIEKIDGVDAGTEIYLNPTFSLSHLLIVPLSFHLSPFRHSPCRPFTVSPCPYHHSPCPLLSLSFKDLIPLPFSWRRRAIDCAGMKDDGFV